MDSGFKTVHYKEASCPILIYMLSYSQSYTHLKSCVCQAKAWRLEKGKHLSHV